MFIGYEVSRMGIEQIMEERIMPLQLPTKFITKIRHDLEYILSCKIEGLEQIILFGSCAKGRVKATSDVDWMIVTQKPIENRQRRHEILCDICEEYKGINADLVFTTVQERQEKNTMFMKVVAEHEIVIWERGHEND